MVEEWLKKRVEELEETGKFSSPESLIDETFTKVRTEFKKQLVKPQTEETRIVYCKICGQVNEVPALATSFTCKACGTTQSIE